MERKQESSNAKRYELHSHHQLETISDGYFNDQATMVANLWPIVRDPAPQTDSGPKNLSLGTAKPTPL
jgi:hypothetical protein